MRDMAERITIVSAERVQGEFTGLLLTDSPREGLDLLVRTGVAEHFLPELPRCAWNATSTCVTRTSTRTR